MKKCNKFKAGLGAGHWLLLLPRFRRMSLRAVGRRQTHADKRLHWQAINSTHLSHFHFGKILDRCLKALRKVITDEAHKRSYFGDKFCIFWGESSIIGVTDNFWGLDDDLWTIFHPRITSMISEKTPPKSHGIVLKYIDCHTVTFCKI